MVSTTLSIPSSIWAWILTSFWPMKNYFECALTFSCYYFWISCDSLSLRRFVCSLLMQVLYSLTLSKKDMLSTLDFSWFLLRSLDTEYMPVTLLSASMVVLTSLTVYYKNCVEEFDVGLLKALWGREKSIIWMAPWSSHILNALRVGATTFSS